MRGRAVGIYSAPMTVDVGRFLRLQGAIEAAVGAIPADQATTAASALVDSYRTLREEVRSVVDESVREEFDRLFPDMQTHAPPDLRRGGGFDPFAAANVANQARTRLTMMGGWLGGFLRAPDPD
jgi:hypothetical protein